MNKIVYEKCINPIILKCPISKIKKFQSINLMKSKKNMFIANLTASFFGYAYLSKNNLIIPINSK